MKTKVVRSEREKGITQVSIIGIVANALLGVAKIIVGLAVKSIAIISDAVNNLTDTSSSIITIIGTHLAARHPDKKHPFGYGRVEYITSLIIGTIVLFTGVEMCETSIKSIIHRDEADFNWLAVGVLVATVVVKIILGAYTLKRGRKLNSSALVASGMDARSDAVATGAALFAALLYIWKGIDIDAWVGAFISLYIVRTGFQILRDTVSKIVGEQASSQLADKIKEIVRQDPIVKGAFDLILNNYGPNYYTGSMNVEVDHNLTAEQIWRSLHPLQKRVYEQTNAFIVFGIYAVDKSSKETAPVAAALEKFCAEEPGVLGYHALFVDDMTHNIDVDIIVDFGIDPKPIVAKLEAVMAKTMPGFTPKINVDAPSA